MRSLTGELWQDSRDDDEAKQALFLLHEEGTIVVVFGFWNREKGGDHPGWIKKSHSHFDSPFRWLNTLATRSIGNCCWVSFDGGFFITAANFSRSFAIDVGTTPAFQLLFPAAVRHEQTCRLKSCTTSSIDSVPPATWNQVTFIKIKFTGSATYNFTYLRQVIDEWPTLRSIPLPEEISQYDHCCAEKIIVDIILVYQFPAKKKLTSREHCVAAILILQRTKKNWTCSIKFDDSSILGWWWERSFIT